MWNKFRLEVSFALLAAFAVWAWSTGYLLTSLILAFAAIIAGGIVTVRWGRVLLHKLIWHLRDRLIVAYVFIAVIPIAVIVLAARWVVLDLGGQIAVYLVNSELDRRVHGLEDIARSLAQVPESRRSAMLDQITTLFEERFPGLRVQMAEGAGDMGPSGIIARKGLLYIRARAAHQQIRVALVAPITRAALASLAPGLGPVSIISLDPASSLKLLDSPQDSPPVELPTPINRFDIELRWASQIPVADFDDASRTHEALLGVRSRVSALLRTLFAATTGRADLRNDIMLAGILLLLAQVISVYIGVSVTQAITQAFNGLYEGTQHVMRGDFTHRVAVKGDDQIAEVTNSFNQMTGNIERLLEVSKEKERFEAELAIARSVQDQLFPRSAPALKSLELLAVCNPARMVSGDYYDYQPLSGSKIAMVLADVAGKGVSAALLMASLQACFRMQTRDLREDPTIAASTSSLVSHINQQLHASTSAEKFATFFLAVYDDVTNELTYTNAGHLPPILVHNGQAKLLDVNGMVVGAFPFAKYDESRVSLEPGDLLFGYTDGVTEAENEFGEMFGEQRLIDVVCKNSALEPTAIFQIVADAVKQFSGSPELQDDMTMIIARRRA